MLNTLVVEDNENLRQLMCTHLILSGYSVFEAGSGVYALDILE